MPRLQIVRGNGGRLSRDPVATQTEKVNTEAEEERRVLRREIKRWWEAIADHMDKLVSTEGPPVLLINNCFVAGDIVGI